MSTFPPELVELIIYDIWPTEMPSWLRQSFMTTCPQINQTWKSVYARITTARDIYITGLGHLHYLCDIARCQYSFIYVDLVPRLTRTMTLTCFVDFRHETLSYSELEALKVYSSLARLPNDIRFRALSPLTEFISLELWWTGGVLLTDEVEVYDLPIRLLRCRCLSKSQDNEDVRTDVDATITDQDPLSDLYPKNWSSLLLALRNRCVPAQLVSSGSPSDASAKGDVLRFGQTIYVRQSKGDLNPSTDACG